MRLLAPLRKTTTSISISLTPSRRYLPHERRLVSTTAAKKRKLPPANLSSLLASSPLPNSHCLPSSSSSPSSPSPQPKMSLFLDFDGTITVVDTTSYLAAIGIRHKRETSTSTDAAATADVDPTTVVAIKQAWAEVVSAYRTDYQRGVETYRPAPAGRTTVEHEIAFLRSLKDLETESLRRVERCGVFKGVSAQTLREGGRRLAGIGAGATGGTAVAATPAEGKGEEEEGVELRPGAREIVTMARRKGWKVWIVSLNWSVPFIEGVCAHLGLETREYVLGKSAGEEGKGGEDDVDVHIVANDIREEDGAIVGPWILQDNPREEGSRETMLTNSEDKVKVLDKIFEAEGLRGKPSIYAGDSAGDIECLLAATKGIVIADRDDTTLLKTLRRIGQQVPERATTKENPEAGAEEVLASSSKLSWAPALDRFASDDYFDDIAS